MLIIDDGVYLVYTENDICDGCECFYSDETLESSHVNYINAEHIMYDQSKNKFYYTEDDLSLYDDFFSKHLMPVIGKFTQAKNKHKKLYTTIKKHDTKISNHGIVDVSGLPAFNVSNTNEDAEISEYRLYITLFNDYTVKQCQYERKALYDAKFKSSKFELESKIQNSSFLKSKDFTVINLKRKDSESVAVGLIIKEQNNDEYTLEYGTVTIDMNNILSIKWH